MLIQIRREPLVQNYFPKLGSRRLCQFGMLAEKRILRVRGVRDPLPVRIEVPGWRLHPTTLSLPWVQRERDAAAGTGIDAAPVHWVSQGIKRTERSQHHREFFILAPQRGQHGSFVAEVMNSLLNGA